MKTLLVGSHFHPPAKLVLEFLPSGTTLTLRPEPDNPYDPLAVLVGIDPSSREWPADFASALEGYGHDIAEWASGDWCPLGHLAKSGGKPLAKHPELQGNAEAAATAETAEGWDNLHATLGFTAEGKPMVEWHAGAKP